jgi:hypothetical protein
MRRRRSRRALIRIRLLAGLAALLIVPSAAAAGVHITGVETSGFPVVRVTVVAPKGSHTPRVRENGRPVVGMVAANLGRAKTLVLALDRSQSMRGKPLANALLAARQFVGTTGASDHVGIVVFGRSAIALQGASGGSAGDAQNTLSSVTVDTRSGTALYDAIAASLALTPIVWPHYLALAGVAVALAWPNLGPAWIVPMGLWFVLPAWSDGNPLVIGGTLFAFASIFAWSAYSLSGGRSAPARRAPSILRLAVK